MRRGKMARAFGGVGKRDWGVGWGRSNGSYLLLMEGLSRKN